MLLSFLPYVLQSTPKSKHTFCQINPLLSIESNICVHSSLYTSLSSVTLDSKTEVFTKFNSNSPPADICTHMCQFLGGCLCSWSTGGFRSQVSWSCQWLPRQGPSLRRMECCCRWRRGEEERLNHRHCWSLKTVLKESQEGNQLLVARGSSGQT